MDHSPVQSDSIGVDPAVAQGITKLWNLVRLAGDTVRRLREEREELRTRVVKLEDELSQVRQELQKKEDLIRRTLEQPARPVHPPQGAFVNGEKELLLARVRELLARIEAYL